MLKREITFIDVETTGINPYHDRVIEIGALRVSNGKIVKTLSSLVNPKRHLNTFISNLTGIRDRDLLNAPEFAEIADELITLMEGSVMVAHNAGFDYSFLRNEFIRCDRELKTDLFCSVRVSKILFPEHKRHGLDYIVTRFNLQVKNRHRAFDDAMLIFHFFENISNLFEPEILSNAFAKSRLTPNVNEEPIDANEPIEKLVKGPGVYIFYDQEGHVLYIGKSVNVENRVKSHFYAKNEKHMTRKVKKVEVIATAGELGAMIRESMLIKKAYPMYNSQLRHQSAMIVLKKSFNKQGYLTLQLQEVDSIELTDLGNLFGIFKSKKQAETILTNICRNKRLCQKLTGLDNNKSACFNYYLGTCLGACMGEEAVDSFNQRLLDALDDYSIDSWPYDGPIMITETSNNIIERLLIDHWCVVKSDIPKELGLEMADASGYRFDFDIFKIIRKYLRNKHNSKAISYFSDLDSALVNFKESHSKG